MVFYIMAHMLGKILLKWISCNQIVICIRTYKLFCLEVISHDQLLIKMCLHELRHNHKTAITSSKPMKIEL